MLEMKDLLFLLPAYTCMIFRSLESAAHARFAGMALQIVQTPNNLLVVRYACRHLARYLPDRLAPPSKYQVLWYLTLQETCVTVSYIYLSQAARN